MDELNKRVQGTPVEVPKQEEEALEDAQQVPPQASPQAESEEAPPNPFEEHDRRLQGVAGQGRGQQVIQEEESAENEEEGPVPFWKKITETDEELDVFQGSPPFSVRVLGDGDTWKAGALLGKAMGDRRISNAMATGDWNTAGMAIVGVLFDSVGRDFQLFLADLIGIERDYQTVKMNMQRECLNEQGRQVMTFPTPEEIRMRLEDEIIAELNSYPPGTSQTIITEVIKRDDFGPFWHSSKLLAKTAGRVWSKLRTS
jgi:hypothetical protein